MADEFISMEWENLKEFQTLFAKLDERFMEILQEEMTAFGMLVEEGTKALSPEAEGDLMDSINFSKAQRSSSGYEVEGGANSVYALRRHEEPYRMGVYPKYDEGSKFPDYYVDGRGAITRSKGTWRGYEAGRKYLTNAIKATEKDWDDMLERVLERAISEGLLE